MIEERKLNRFDRYVVCPIIAHDPEKLAKCEEHDKQVSRGKAALLVLVAFSSSVLSSAFWWQFMPAPVAVGVGIFAFFYILFLDQFVGGTVWALRGILRKPGLKVGKVLLAGRLGIAALFATGNSIGLEIIMGKHAIEAQRVSDKFTEDQKTNQTFGAKADQIRKQTLGNTYEVIQEEKKEINTVQPKLDEARQKQAGAANALAAAKIQAHREKYGEDGFPKGMKKNYQAALAAQAAAETDLAKAKTDIEIYQARLKAAQDRQKGAEEDAKAKEPLLQPQLNQLEDERKRSLVPEGNDAISSYILLQEVYADPKRGTAARFLGWLFFLMLMAVELSFVAVCTWFIPATIYEVRLIGDTADEAETLNEMYRQRREARLGMSLTRQPLEVVS
jgi:hypothetical protein